MSTEKFCPNKALEPLMDFQLRTVDYVFDRLYGQNDPLRQFLVADEVGLGKTLVARGVIARVIEHLWESTQRINVIYICSNQAIAAQNLNRLNVLDLPKLALPTRITLIPLHLRGQNGLDANKVNFISLTPGTTFDLRSATGVREERALLLHLLRELVSQQRGLHNLLQVSAGIEGWNRAVENITLEGVDERIIRRFSRDVGGDSGLLEELERVCEMFALYRDTYPADMTQPRQRLVARLRARLSHACVDALQPNLIIMDEFQRFRDLLHGKSDAAELARELFDYSGGDGEEARTLLLSATPYRMLTLNGDNPDEGDHYRDFLETLEFLYGRERGKAAVVSLAREMRAFRGFLHDLPQSLDRAIVSRKSMEKCLRKVIARTERVSSTINRDSMLVEKPVIAKVKPADLVQAAAVWKVAQVLEAPEIIEYWKSAPYLLNFMRHYRLKRLLEAQADSPSAPLLEAIQAAMPATLNQEALDAYDRLEPANGRMRAIMDDVFGAQLEQSLWIPASLPYYGEGRTNPPPTKALIFSSWQMVPEAIAALLSYEAERLMGVGKSGRRYFQKHRLRPLRFQKVHDRLSGLRAMLLIYPSPTLAKMADPLAVFAGNGDVLSEDAMRAAVADRLTPALDALRRAAASHEGHVGTALAAWAAPAVMDDLLSEHSSTWLASPDGMQCMASEDGFHEHVAELSSAAARRDFGVIPDDLAGLLVDVALGSPAVCALRALRRIAPELAWDNPRLLGSAARVAWAFRTLFNQHDVVALLRRGEDDRYWHRVLTYGAKQNLQSVLDEYSHFLVDEKGLVACAAEERVVQVGEAMARALSIRPSQIDIDAPRPDGNALTIGKFHMRGRFAMRLADYRDEEGTVARVGGVRDAFNSPFRPFVLTTTSIGQEGLDFHPFCYRVYHWNLPGNPVDMEQREGRVHRFKSHAVRLNLAERQAGAMRGCGKTPDDPWRWMFAQARSEQTMDKDIVPYWIYEGTVTVERRIPMLPFSREVASLEWLKRSLAVYRLAFGQPRQEDLLDYLRTLAASGFRPQDLEDLQIRLEPIAARSAEMN